jgi:hypothetical protein
MKYTFVLNKFRDTNVRDILFFIILLELKKINFSRKLNLPIMLISEICVCF